MKFSYAAIALIFASTQAIAGGFNKAADAALKINDLNTYFHELAEAGGSYEQCLEMLEIWNQAIANGANNYANQPDQQDFQKAKLMCSKRFKHFNNAGKAGAGVVY